MKKLMTALLGLSLMTGLATLSVAKDDAKTDDTSKAKSKKAKKQEEKKSSTTNKQKARKKNFLMTLGKAKGKQKRSLVETKKVLKGHIDRKKRGGRRGNQG